MIRRILIFATIYIKPCNAAAVATVPDKIGVAWGAAGPPGVGGLEGVNPAA